MADRSVTVRLQALVAPYVAGMGKASAATTGFARTAQTQLAGTTAKTSKLGQATGFLPGRFAAISAASTAGFAAVGLGVAAAVKTFADFDQKMSAVKAATGATGSELGKLREAAIKMGAATQFGATEAADGIEQLAKAGVSTADIVGGGLKGALDLAAAGEIGVGDAAETAATAMTQFKLSGRDVPHIADLLAAAAGKAQGDVSDMAMALKQSGLVASQMGLSVEEATGTLGAFASAGLVGSDAGTSFRTMLLRLANPAGKAAELMNDLGIAAYDAQGNFVGIQDLAGQLQQKLGGLSQAQRDAALATIFGSDAIRAANVLYEQGSAGIADWTDKVDDTGYAAEQAATRTDNLRGDIERLGGALETLAIGQAGQANDSLRELVQTLEDAVTAVDQGSRSFFDWYDRSQEFYDRNIFPGIVAGIDSLTAGAASAAIGLDGVTASTEKAETAATGWASELERNAEQAQINEAATARLAGQADDYAERAKNGAAETASLAGEMADLRQELYDTADAFLGLRDSEVGYEQAVDDATDAVKANGKTLDINTQKGRDNRTALDRIAGAALKVMQQMEDTGASQDDMSARSASMRGELVKAAGRFGLNKAQAEAYADQILGIPKSANTNLTVTGAGAARQAVLNLRRAILNLPSGKTVHISYVSSVTGARVGSGTTLADGGYVGRPRGYPAGGMVYGPGTSRSDSIPAFLSNGEFVVNAAATATNRGLLEAINSGRSGGSGSVTLINRGVIGSQIELENWLARGVDNLRRQGRLPA